VAEQRRRTAQVSRLLHLLRAHGLIAKIPHTHRYRVTAKGEALMSAAVYARCKVFPKELQDIA
jgi:DNA-binding IclR family transcriptional regulator